MKDATLLRHTLHPNRRMRGMPVTVVHVSSVSVSADRMCRRSTLIPVVVPLLVVLVKGSFRALLVHLYA